MKILFVSHTAGWAGAEHILYLLLQGLNRGKYEPLVVLPGHGLLEEKVKQLGIETRVADLAWWYDLHESPPLNFVHGLKDRVQTLARLIQNEKIDLVFTTTVTVPEGALAACLSGVPHLWYLCELLRSDSNLRPFVNPVLFCNLLESFCNKFTADSQTAKEEIQPYFKTKEVEVIHPGLPLSKKRENAESPERQPENTGTSKVCFVGTIAFSKGLECLARAAEQVLDELPETQFIFIGPDGGARDTLETRLKKFRGGRTFQFLGFRGDILEQMMGCDLLVLPSHAESFGLVLLEAMSLAKPVIATRCGGPEEIVVDRETGILVPVNDPPALARAITFLLKNPSERNRMGRKGKERAAKVFAYEEFVKKFEDLFDELSLKKSETVYPREGLHLLLNLLDEIVLIKKDTWKEMEERGWRLKKFERLIETIYQNPVYRFGRHVKRSLWNLSGNGAKSHEARHRN